MQKILKNRNFSVFKSGILQTQRNKKEERNLVQQRSKKIKMEKQKNMSKTKIRILGILIFAIGILFLNKNISTGVSFINGFIVGVSFVIGFAFTVNGKLNLKKWS